MTEEVRFSVSFWCCVVTEEVMLFLVLHILGEEYGGWIGSKKFSTKMGLSVGTLSNYLQHVRFALIQSLEVDDNAKIIWLLDVERKVVQGLVCRLPRCVGSVDGTKQKIFRPENENMREEMYCGQHYFNCFSALVQTDVFGMIIRLDIIRCGSSHDRGIYNQCDVFVHPILYFSNAEFVIGDSGFQGEGSHIVFPYKLIKGSNLSLRKTIGRNIRTQRVRNKWSISLILNRFRLFLGCWTIEASLWHLVYEVAAHLVNQTI